MTTPKEEPFWDKVNREWLRAMQMQSARAVTFDAGDEFSEAMRAKYPGLAQGAYPKRLKHFVSRSHRAAGEAHWTEELRAFIADCFALERDAHTDVLVTSDSAETHAFRTSVDVVLESLPVLVTEPDALIVGLPDASKLLIVDEYDEAHFMIE